MADPGRNSTSRKGPRAAGHVQRCLFAHRKRVCQLAEYRHLPHSALPVGPEFHLRETSAIFRGHDESEKVPLLLFEPYYTLSQVTWYPTFLQRC